MPLTLSGTDGVLDNSGALIRDAVKSATGTAVDFTGIPNWVKRITVMFDGISTNGTSAFLIQLGSGSVQTSGYSGSCSNVSGTGSASASTSTSGFQTATAASAATSYNGMFTILNVTGNDYILHGQQSNTVPGSNFCGGNVGLAGKLDRVRITTVGGTDTFDAGTINILYE